MSDRRRHELESTMQLLVVARLAFGSEKPVSQDPALPALEAFPKLFFYEVRKWSPALIKDQS